MAIDFKGLDSPLMQKAEVSALLKVNSTTIINWTQRGFLRTYRVGLRDEFFDRDEVEKLLKRLEAGDRSLHP